MNKNSTEISISSEYITLGQFIKFVGAIQTGGEAKSFLRDSIIQINGENDNRRGRKLRSGDVIKVNDKVYRIL